MRLRMHHEGGRVNGWLTALVVVGCIIGASCVVSTCLVVAILAAGARHRPRIVIVAQKHPKDPEKD